MDSPVVFEQTIEGLFMRGLEGRLTPTARERLKALGVDLSRRLLPAYSFATWMAALKVAAEEVYGSHSEAEAMFKLGEQFIDGYQNTMLGRAVLGLVRVLGPKRTLMRATQNFRSGNNYTETKLSDLGQNAMELWMNEVGPYPSFTAGIVHAAMRASGAQGLSVETKAYDGHAATYLVRWG